MALRVSVMVSSGSEAMGLVETGSVTVKVLPEEEEVINSPFMKAASIKSDLSLSCGSY